MDRPLVETPTHVADLVHRAAVRSPSGAAIVDIAQSHTYTWAGLSAAIGAEAARLRAAGVAPGDRVVVRLPGGVPFCVAMLGAQHAGGVAVPLGPAGVDFELDAVLGDCAPRTVIAVEDDEDASRGAAGRGAVLLPAPDPTAGQGSGEPTGGGEDIALLAYTGRPTQSPRGALLSHRALLANRAQVAAVRPPPITSVDRVLLALPLFHVFGFAAGFLQVCWSRATTVLPDRLDADGIAEVLADHQVSVLLGTPTLYRGLLDLPPSRLRAAFADVRLCLAGGAPLPLRWHTEFETATGLPLFESYGLTEAGPIVATTLTRGRAKPGSVGRPLPGIELRLVDPEGRPLEHAGVAEASLDEFPGDPAADTGTIALRGSNVFSGYWPDGAGGPDADGWFTTNDVGFVDDDGDLHLVDRSSEVVVVSGFTVYPREVEEVLALLDGVREVAAVGVPDERTGEAVKAVVVPVPGAQLTADAVREHCAARLAPFKVPTVVTFSDALPRTPTGKVARRLL